ncbi:MAG TPA: SBBP repeat-containing protein, partial [Anaerolineales bacterium]
MDNVGNAYVTATILLNPPFFDYPTTSNALLSPSFGGPVRAVVTKLDASGSSLLYSTYLGSAPTAPTSSGSISGGIVVDTSGNAYVTGRAEPVGFFTTTGAFAACSMMNPSVFVMKLNTTSLISVPPVYSPCLGPGWGTGIAVDT